jgi:hypothetical protein
MRNKVKDLMSFYYGALLGFGIGGLTAIFVVNYPNTKSPLVYTATALSKEVQQVATLGCLEGKIGVYLTMTNPKEPEVNCKAVGEKWKKVYTR